VSSSLNEAEISLMALEALQPDALAEIEASIEGEAASLILYRDAQGGVHAFRNICPHAGRRLDYAPGKFVRTKGGELLCAVHGATFSLPAGVCVAGPCRGECLCAVAVHVAEGQIRLGEADAQ
jgi:nitrite reductase/ring-hydroxylating ferredoxin subunit